MPKTVLLFKLLIININQNKCLPPYYHTLLTIKPPKILMEYVHFEI